MWQIASDEPFICSFAMKTIVLSDVERLAKKHQPELLDQTDYLNGKFTDRTKVQINVTSSLMFVLYAALVFTGVFVSKRQEER